MVLWNDFKYLVYTMFHPFDGFYELRFRKERNDTLIAIIFIIFGITSIFDMFYTGFIIQSFDGYGVNNFIIFATAVFPFILFAVANWSVTALFDGSGSVPDILMVLAYSLVPKILFDITGIFLSNIIIQEEIIMYTSFVGIGTVFFVFLVFIGLCIIHEYTALMNIVTLFATFLSAIIMVFIGMFFMTILGRMFGFISTIFLEITKRWIV